MREIDSNSREGRDMIARFNADIERQRDIYESTLKTLALREDSVGRMAQAALDIAKGK